MGGIILKRDTLPSEAQRNTAEVLKAIDADIQCVVEVEDRLTLERFNQSLLKGGRAYPYNILIDGNDPRGIDVGLLSRFPFTAVNTHVFDKAGKTSKSRIFSRDCLEGHFGLPRPIVRVVNHFKSQGYGFKRIKRSADSTLSSGRSQRGTRIATTSYSRLALCSRSAPCTHAGLSCSRHGLCKDFCLCNRASPAAPLWRRLRGRPSRHDPQWRRDRLAIPRSGQPRSAHCGEVASCGRRQRLP